MSKLNTPAEYKDKFHIIFVGMFWRNDSDPIYDQWTEGRIEIRSWQDDHANDEVRYCTEKNDEWFAFQTKYNGKWVTGDELEMIKKKVKDKFKNSPGGNI